VTEQFTIPVSERPATLWQRLLPIAVISTYFAINLAIVQPWGNFPLNDDWMYSHSVKALMETGRLKLLGCCPSCALHIVLGALVCIPQGFSHVTLRMFNFCISAASVFALYGTLLEIRVTRKVACLAALVYAATPLFVNMSYTFMTDLTSLSFTTLYSYFMVRSLSRRSLIALIGASIMLICAISVRQTNTLYVACNFVLMVLLMLRKRPVKTLLIALVILPTVWAFALERMMELMNEYPAAYDWYKMQLWHMAENTLQNPAGGVFALLAHGGKALAYLGAFVSPLLIPFIPALFKSILNRRTDTYICTASSALVAACTAYKLVGQEKRLMPFSENLLHIPRMGNLTIIVSPLLYTRRFLRNWLTAICMAWGFVLSTVLFAGLHRCAMLAGKYIAQSRCETDLDHTARRLLIVIFAFLSMLVSLAWVVLHTMICDLDRYYLMPLVPIIICLAIIWRWMRLRPIWILMVPLAVLIASYSAAAEQDYLGWNTVRWMALNRLEKEGVTSDLIDGGTEYNYSKDPALSGDVELGPGIFNWIHKGAFPRSKWRSWSLHGEEYIISFSPLEDYSVVAHYRYWSDLYLRNREVLILKRAKPIVHRANKIP
jgi:hypothetical protein